MKKKICMILIAVFVAVLGTSTYFIIDHYKESNKQAALYGELAELVDAAVQTDAATEPAEQIPYSEEKMLLPELAELYQQNGDLVGWISIADTNINYPVMQSANEPNFYLKHGFDKEYSDYGCPYVQEDAMLEKHIADQEELPDNTDVIRRKQGEIEKLMNKRTNLIEMRAEGDIDKEMFRSKKQEIEDRVAKLTEEIKGLQPEKEQTSNEDYSVKLLELRERLKEYTGFDYSVIPESIVEAFIERIWVSKDEFRWYLRTGNKAEGEFDPDDHIKIGSFTLTIDDAKKYIYSFSTRRRVYKWVDLNVSVWI